MILSQRNFNNGYTDKCSCGSIGRCNTCVYKLICEHSPYCFIKNIDNEKTKIQDIYSIVENIISDDACIIDNQKKSMENITNIYTILKNLSESINEINTKIDKLSQCNNSIINQNSNLVEPVEAETVIENGLVPKSNIENDTVLVEKKNIFGKTKWVEEKKKK